MNIPFYSEFDRLEASVRPLERLVLPAGVNHVTAIQKLHVKKRSPAKSFVQVLNQPKDVLWHAREKERDIEIGVIFLASLPERCLTMNGLQHWLVGSGSHLLPVDAAFALRNAHDWHTLYYRLWDADHHRSQCVNDVVVMHKPIEKRDGTSSYVGFRMNDNHIHAFDAYETNGKCEWLKPTSAVLVELLPTHPSARLRLDPQHSN
jgi:hypothetical protein